MSITICSIFQLFFKGLIYTIISVRYKCVSQQANIRDMFNRAIELQEELIADANRRIEHYRWALEEMDKQDNVIDAKAV